MLTAMILHARDQSEYWFDEGCHITEWSNRADDPAVSIARARVEPGMTTRWHRLRGIDERYLILSGGGRVELRCADGVLTCSDVGPGDVVRIPAGVAQRISAGPADDLLFVAICTPRFNAAAYEDLDDPA